ncbi:tetratricopeptide repeat protein [Planotetraspora sp. A-T 1434]|uniref:tetratricopeptide repeat protein n=1 Tax=Planotetraspora sp. A-T 1434 TaxID=2979219 RepID=UPI0021BFCC51|nr:tetratricopeptide repeat protein [Planotetraspora sp. A-T 1434]MCT9932936.1 tetratricopeptide repeat protein [Planotetraspora sp. A-T 1434]
MVAELADLLPMDVDIWAWVAGTQRELHEAGNAGLAMALGDVPAQALEGRYAQLDVVAPAVAQHAETLGQPWLELFARYWHVLGRVGDRANGAVALEDAAALVEFAARDDVRDCPSAPAAVEALAITQANTDGPGYAEARLAALGAALDGVGPESLAFSGLVTQYVAALIDAGQAGEAVGYAEAAVERLSGAGREASWELGATAARALLAVGRADDALTALEAATGFKPDDPVAKGRREGLLKSLILATLGRTEEAVDALPDLDVVGDHPRDWVEWGRAVALLAGSGSIANTWQLGRILRQWITYFQTMGGHRARFELALTAGRLAIARQGLWQARLLADEAEAVLADLENTDGLPERIAELRAAVDRAPELPPPGPQDELVAYFEAADGRTADPERWVGWLWPLSGTDLEATRRHTTTLGFLGYSAAGADIYWAMVDGDPAAADPEDIAYLTGLLIEAGQDERVERLAERLPESQSHLALARLYRARERWEETAAEAELAVAAGALVEGSRLWSGAVQQLGDNAKAADILRPLLELEDREEEDVWRLIVLATAAEDWATVRAAAATLGMPLQSEEGPIEEEWHLIRAILPAPDGSQREVLAVRTGPATARLAIPQPRGMEYNAGDVIVVDPRPLEPIPEDPQERESFVIPFAGVSMLWPGGYTSWFFDGAAPSEDEWAEFNELLAERGWPMWVYSDEGYHVTHPATGERLPGVFGWIAVPPTVTPSELDAVLDDATEQWVHPLSWLDLAREVGVETERHERIVKEYGL